MFALGSLGWKAFQDLCGTVLGAVLGQTVTAFRPTRDAGRDFAFEGQWVPQGGEALTGQFVVQCKFKASGNFYRSDLADELPKVLGLVRSGRCESYVLMTNAGMTASTEAKLQEGLAKQGVRHALLIGGDQLDRYIRETPRLRALVPRLYGLGDLTQILDERRYQQAAALLASMREDIAKFVVTEPYRKAANALLTHGFVLLLGAPAAGKSMIASALAAASIDMWGSRPMKIEGASAFAAAWNPLEPDQFLWIDDAFGATQYQRQRADEWNQVLPQLKAAVAHGAKVVMTSRDCVWAEAIDDLKLSVFPGLETGQVVVDVHDLSLDDKRQILYNHLKFGSQPRAFRSAVKPFLESVARLGEFLPEVARRLGDPQFTANLEALGWQVLAFFERPVEHLTEVVGGLGPDEFAALALLFMSEGSRQSPIELSELETRVMARLGSSLGGVIVGLAAMRGSLVTLGPNAERRGEEEWAFKHPTIGDAVQRRIAGRRELLQLYLLGSAIEGLVGEITCGDVGLAGALVVPRPYFGDIASRLAEGLREPGLSRRVADFLATRCSAEFLARHGAAFTTVQLDLSHPATPRVAARLQAIGLLPEVTRNALIGQYQRAAIEHLDLRVVTDPQIRGLMSQQELDDFVFVLRDRVVAGLTPYLEAEGDDYDGTESPEDVVARIHDILEVLAETYPDDSDVAEVVEEARDELGSLEGRMEEEWHGDRDDDDYDGWRDRQSMSRPSDSGVFMDVDE